MFTNRLAIAAGIAALGTSAYAQSSVTVYGNMDIAISRTNNGSGTTLPGGAGAGLSSQGRTTLDSGVGPGSRIGFRGREDLGGGLAAVFVAEMGVGADTGAIQQGGLGFGRQVFVGLSGKDWTLTAGRQYSPLDVGFGTNEARFGLWWGNAVGASGHGLYPGLGSAPGSGTFTAGSRIDNSLMGSMKFGPVTARLMIGMGNENVEGTGRLINPHLAYVSGRVNVQASILRQRAPIGLLATGAPNAWMTEKLLNGAYDFGAFTLMGGIYTFEGPPVASRAAIATPGAVGASPFAYGWDDTRTVYLGARVPLGTQNHLSMSLSRHTYNYATGPDGNGTTIGILGEHLLSKRTTIYASFGKVINDTRARTPLISTITAVVPNGFGSDPSAISLGMRHQF